jgi:hypothetical protein
MAIQTSRILRFTALPILFGIAIFFEIRHLVPYFRLLNFIFLFLGFAVLASLVRGKFRDGLLVVSTLLFGLCVIEGVSRLIEPRSQTIMTPGWSVLQPIIGWGPQHPGVFHAQKIDPKSNADIYNAEYTIDADLMRQVVSGSGLPAIIFFGDSYTFGDGVNDLDTWPQIFSDLNGRKQKVMNLAFTGYGPQQFLREMETGLYDHVIGQQPGLFVFLTAPWHAERTSCKSYWTPFAPRYAIENGKVTFQGLCNEGANLMLREYLENTAAYRVFIEPYRHKVNRDDVELYIRTLVAAVQLAKQKYNVPTIIPYLRVPDEYLRASGFTDEEIMKRFEDGGAIVIDASLRDEVAKGNVVDIPGDGHPTPFANHARAQMLKDYLATHMPEKLVSTTVSVEQETH